MFLSATTQSLELDLNAAVATNQLPVTLWYVDIDQTTKAVGDMIMVTTQSNGTTAVTICSGPGAGYTRQIKGFTVKNSDTASVLLWTQINDNGTLREQTKCTLAVNDALQYTDTDGHKTIDANGAAKYSQGGWTIAAGKSGTLNNSITFAGTDGTTVTFPSTSATVARTDAGQTFTGTNTFGALTLTGNVGVTGTPSFTLTGCSFTAGAGTFTTLGIGAANAGGVAYILSNTAVSALMIERTSATAAQWILGIGSDGSFVFNQKDILTGFSIAPTTGAVTIPGTLALTATATPTGTGAGAVGQIAWDTSYLYICTATNDWRRVALTDF